MSNEAQQIEQNVKNFMEENKIELEYKFVPFSQSRNKKDKPKINDLSYNYIVKVVVNGKTVLVTDYSMGIAHAKNYKQTIRYSVDEANLIKKQCETGKYYGLATKPILPKDVNVIYCLMTDMGVLSYSNFEEWAENYGYDADSIKAEKMYNECLQNALTLNNGIHNVEELREIVSEY
jgi:hypothetical protein